LAAPSLEELLKRKRIPEMTTEEFERLSEEEGIYD
jgi:hypothetical protein